MPPSTLSVFFVGFISSTGSKVSKTFSCASAFMNANLLHCIKNLNLSLMHVVSWWVGACDCTVPPRPYLELFSPCSCECAYCFEFYPLGWGLSWSLISWFWLVSHQSVLLLCLLSIHLCFSLHRCSLHNFILLLGQVCIPLLVILPQLCHRHHHYPYYHHHCPHFIHQVTHWYGSQV